jgi:hypothetical protein
VTRRVTIKYNRVTIKKPGIPGFVGIYLDLMVTRPNVTIRMAEFRALRAFFGDGDTIQGIFENDFLDPAFFFPRVYPSRMYALVFLCSHFISGFRLQMYQPIATLCLKCHHIGGYLLTYITLCKYQEVPGGCGFDSRRSHKSRTGSTSVRLYLLQATFRQSWLNGDNAFRRTFRRASAALRTLFIIDRSQKVFDMDSVKFAVFLTELAANAADFAVDTRRFTRVVGMTSHTGFAIVGNQLNQTFRAGCRAHAAGGTFFIVNDRNAVYHRNGAEFALQQAGSAAQAAVNAGFGAAARQLHQRRTAGHAFIIISKITFAFTAGASDESALPGLFLYGDAHDLPDFPRRFISAHRASIGFGLAFDDGVRERVAARKAAAAAIGAGQCVAYQRQSRIRLHLELDGGDPQAHAQQEPHAPKRQHGVNNANSHDNQLSPLRL